MNFGECYDAIERLALRLQGVFGRGRIRTSTDDAGVQFVQLELGADEVRDGTPRLAEFGFTSSPPVGSDVLAVFIAGDRSKGVVVATGHQASRPRNLLSGESMVYSQDGKYIKFTASGGIVIEAQGQDVVVNNAANVTVHASTKVTIDAPLCEVTGDLKVDGTITGAAGLAISGTPTGGGHSVAVAGDVQVTGGDVTVDGISSKHHVHPGVQSGLSNTGGPV